MTSSSLVKSGGITSLSLMFMSALLFTRLNNSTKEIGFESKLERAAPRATNICEFSGEIISSSLKFKVSTNLSFSIGKKWRGPPKKATFPLIGLPQARFEIVWLTTDWKTEIAMSDLLAPWLISACTSVLAKTPQRDAIGYIFS